MKKAFECAIKQFKAKQKNLIDLLKPFTTIKILDSSGIELPFNMKEPFKGYGGDASQAALKIQVMFNYIEGQVEQTTITEARKNDQSFEEHLKEIERGALYLQDLGYFKAESFEKIANANAYFITRYLSQTKIFNEEQKEINLYKVLKNAGNFFRGTFLMGSKTKLKVRLIAQRLPKEEADKRVRKIRMDARRKGYTPKEETLKIARWSIYLTNVPEAKLSDESIHFVYTLRW